jgi:hypothetical protein
MRCSHDLLCAAVRILLRFRLPSPVSHRLEAITRDWDDDMPETLRRTASTDGAEVCCLQVAVRKTPKTPHSEPGLRGKLSPTAGSQLPLGNPEPDGKGHCVYHTTRASGPCTTKWFVYLTGKAKVMSEQRPCLIPDCSCCRRPDWRGGGPAAGPAAAASRGPAPGQVPNPPGRRRCPTALPACAAGPAAASPGRCPGCRPRMAQIALVRGTVPVRRVCFATNDAHLALHTVVLVSRM